MELYSLAKPRSQKVNKNPNDIEYERNCDECTFQPELMSKTNQQQLLDSKPIFAKSVDKTIDRMKKARIYQVAVKKMFERGYQDLPKNFKEETVFSQYTLTQEQQPGKMSTKPEPTQPS